MPLPCFAGLVELRLRVSAGVEDVQDYFSGLRALSTCINLRSLAVAHPVVSAPRYWPLQAGTLMPLQKLLKTLQVSAVKTFNCLKAMLGVSLSADANTQLLMSRRCSALADCIPVYV